MGPKITTSNSLDCWHKAGWVHRFILLMPNAYISAEILINLIRPHFNICSILVNHCNLRFLSKGDKWNLMSSYILCIVHSEMIFWSIKRSYMSYSSLSVSFKQFDRSSLDFSLHQGVFRTKEMLLTGCSIWTKNSTIYHKQSCHSQRLSLSPPNFRHYFNKCLCMIKSHAFRL